MSEPVNQGAPNQRFSRRRALIAAGGVVVAVGAAAALARGPRRADGLPSGVDLARARPLGDGFFVVDGWVLTAADINSLQSSALPALP